MSSDMGPGDLSTIKYHSKSSKNLLHNLEFLWSKKRIDISSKNGLLQQKVPYMTKMSLLSSVQSRVSFVHFNALGP